MGKNQDRLIEQARAAGLSRRQTPPSWLEDRPIQLAVDDRLSFQESAAVFARQLTTTRTVDTAQSLTVSLEGPWGSGKSSYSQLLIQQLKALGGENPPLVVPFNVWQSGARSLSPWGALAYRIGEAFYSAFHRQCIRCPKNQSVKLGSPAYLAGDDRVRRRTIMIDPENAELKDARLHWVEVAHRLSLAVPKKEWAPSLKLFGDAPSKVPGRQLSWRQGGLDAVLGLGKAGLSLATGGAGDAIKGTGLAASSLLDKRLLEGPAWGTDTLEFVEQLDQLLAVLRPEATTWRCIIAVDDITRLSEKELPAVFEALGYLRELRDVLVLLSLDQGIIAKLEAGESARSRSTEEAPGNEAPGNEAPGNEENAPAAVPKTRVASRRPPTEPFLTRLVNIRLQIPQPRPGELGRMLGSYFEDLQLPSVWASAAVRRLLQFGVRTPRQIKRALLWLWLRLDQAQTPSLADEFDDSVLRFLLDVYLETEGHAALNFSSYPKSVLTRLAMQPWDLRPWIDRDLYRVFESVRRAGILDSGGSALVDLENATALLTEQLRLLSVVAHFDEHQLEGHRLDGRREWDQWQNLLESTSGGLRQAILDRDVNSLYAAWTTFLEDDLPAAVVSVMIELASIARYFDLPDSVSSPTPGEEIRWFDVDSLFKAAGPSQADPQLQAMASTLKKLVTEIRHLVTEI